MAEYTIEIKRSAVKEISALSDQLITRLAEKIEDLARKPRPIGSRKLRGFKDLWRIRVGDYRVVYIIDDKEKLVSITRIAHRREVYDL